MSEIQHAQKFEQSYITGYYVTYCLWSPQLARGTEQTAQCQSTRPFSRVAIGKGSGYTRLPLPLPLKETQSYYSIDFSDCFLSDGVTS